ncbi:hypothetical protein [Salinimicrobium sp. GXAS 041]|uniref:hypothetical protein n=1 Tax=Salinimicrobium sp. GXAS 041 TaxID=3400806 RepID=UPI003C70CE7D
MAPQEHLPRDTQTTSEEEWGYTLMEFLGENWPYLLGILIVLGVFLYSRYSWRKRHEKNRMN